MNNSYTFAAQRKNIKNDSNMKNSIMRRTFLLFTLLAFITIKNQAQTTVTDIDGNVYYTVIIGTQVWMEENLKTTKYRNGDLIGTTLPDTLNISSESTPKYQWVYNSNANNLANYGRLYTWYSATDSRGVCPVDWHLPTHDEWTTLERYICTSGSCLTDFPFDTIAWGSRGTNEGGTLKETGITHWNSPNNGATNTSGFTALAGGDRDEGGKYLDIGYDGCWWSYSEFEASSAWVRELYFYSTNVYRSYRYKYTGHSVRCVKNASTQIPDINDNPQIKIYPNPIINNLNIDCAEEKAIKMQVYNLIGNCVFQSVLTNGINERNLSFLTSGIYIIKLTGIDRTYTLKLIKN